MLERIDFGVSGFDTAFVLAAALLSDVYKRQGLRLLVGSGNGFVGLAL